MSANSISLCRHCRTNCRSPSSSPYALPTGKDEAKGARGHSSLRAATDTELEVSQQGDVFTVRATKQRELDGSASHRYKLRVVELGADEDGEPVTTCVVVPVDSGELSEKERRGKIKRREKILVQCLDQILLSGDGVAMPDEVRQSCPDSIESGQLVVPMKSLRSAFVARLAMEPDSKNLKPDSLGKIFRRTVKEAQDTGRIGVFEEYVWLLE